jgi:hypothetical protein
MLLQSRFVNKNFYYEVICITAIELSLRRTLQRPVILLSLFAAPACSYTFFPQLSNHCIYPQSPANPFKPANPGS